MPWIWAPWCTNCRAEAPDVAEGAAEYAGRATFLGVPGSGEVVNACHAGQLRGELDALVRDLPSDRQRLESLAVLFGVSDKAVQRVVAAEGATIRPRGRHRQLTKYGIPQH